jgi:type VI secretion system protein ImpA
MASSLTLDLEHLLSPIPGQAPSGTDPRSDTAPTSPYQIVKDARYAAADAERGLERGFAESADAKRAEAAARQSWPLILASGTALIASTAKDLEVAAWVTEALLRLHRIAGLRDGLLLIEGLVKQYWDGLFPLPDEDGLETRLAALAGLSGGESEGRLIHPLKQVPLTDGDDPPPVAYWQYEIAASVRGDQADGSVTAADFSNRLHHSSPQFVRDLMEDAQACLDAVTRLDAALAVHCGNESPSFSRLRETLSDILDALRLHAPASTIGDPEVTAEPIDASSALAAENGQTHGSGQAAGRILDRQGAFRQLEELAAFFRRTEPHSPIAYAIENLVRRGRMSFPELIEELIVDDSARRTYFINAGIQPPPDGSGS